MILLGLNAFFHDSAAAIVIDGVIVAAAQEERFTRIKHDYNFPTKAIEFCLKEAKVTPEMVDAVVFYEKPLLKFERILETYLAFAPKGFSSFLKAMPLWLKQKLFTTKEIDKNFKGQYSNPIYYIKHHEAHAASAFFPSPFEKSAIICIDGVGEWSTTTWGIGENNRIDLKQEIAFPHSVGLLYSAFTYYTGFRVNSGEYKLMGLAPYGEPKYVDLIFDNIVDLKADGSFWLDMSYFNYCQGLTMTSAKFHKLFGGEPRKSETKISKREMDIAASIQVATEKIIQHIADHVYAQTGLENLCLAGGCALNCVSNGKLLQNGPFKNIWIQPAAGDAGGALGAALFGYYQISGNKREVKLPDSQSGSYLGSEYSQAEVNSYLDSNNSAYKVYEEEELQKKIAELLAEGKVVGHFNGRCEFGPRALGNRSILGDPRNTQMQRTMNLKIKFRESFRPFAPSCLAEKTSDYFELPAEKDSPYMLLVAPVKKSRCKQMTEQEESLFGIDKLNIARSDLPSITHVDYSARVQSVTTDTNPRYYGLIREFEKLTGCATVVNTSFNIRGEPIVESPADAYKCFMFTDMDALVLNNTLCLKTEQAELSGAEEYKKQFKLD